MKKLLLILAIMTVASIANGQIVITGVYDCTLVGGIPKGIELYCCSDVGDLDEYGIASANNGGGSAGVEFYFPSTGPIPGGTYIYVASEAVGFQTWFGFAPDFTTYAMSINGDDAIELYRHDVVVDVFGDVDMDGSGTAWEYLDGWAKRYSGTGPDGSTFVIGSWNFSGPNALDGESDNATAQTPFPLGGFQCDPAVPTVDTNWGAVKSLYR